MQQPPEILANILAQCTEYCREAWPHAVTSEQSGEEEWMNNWRGGMEILEGL